MVQAETDRVILAKSILFCGQNVTLVCDGNCAKAWGTNRRPKVQLSSNEDDYAFLADGELPDAPINPGTYEGADGKPIDYTDLHRQNKWCARECERSDLHEAGELCVRDFSVRRYNIRQVMA